MNVREFAQAFELKYNAILSNSAPNLNLYEMSYFLTVAQKEIVEEIYNGSYNGNSFEATEDSRQYINHLIREYRTSNNIIGLFGVSKNSKFYTYPEDVWFRVFEAVDYNDDSIDCEINMSTVLVKPITYDEYHIIKNNPFKRELLDRVLRLDYDGNTVELISKYNIQTYRLKYIVMPKPIILEDIYIDDLTIDGIGVVTECELNSVIHESILNRAVDLAKLSWQGAANSKV